MFDENREGILSATSSHPSKIKRIETGASCWKIGPGDGTFNESASYPYVTNNEMRELENWLRRLPGSKHKNFIIHAIGEDGIAVTLGPKKTTPRTDLRKLEWARLLNLWRGTDHRWIAVPMHTITCATRTG